MKTSIKLKELKAYAEGRNVYFVGYCGLQSLLKFVSPSNYYANAYGWRFDVYEIDNETIITTGYASPRGIKTKRLKEVEKYENLARNTHSEAETMELLKELIELNK